MNDDSGPERWRAAAGWRFVETPGDPTARTQPTEEDAAWLRLVDDGARLPAMADDDPRTVTHRSMPVLVEMTDGRGLSISIERTDIVQGDGAHVAGEDYIVLGGAKLPVTQALVVARQIVTLVSQVQGVEVPAELAAFQITEEPKQD